MDNVTNAKEDSLKGEGDLSGLLSSMRPILLEGEYVFCTFPDARYGDHHELQPIASCVETEGLTLVVPRHRADEQDVKYERAFSAISLSVHSSLEAIGLTAAIATKLTECGISANVVAGYFHDHIFVQSELAAQAMAALAELAGRFEP